MYKTITGKYKMAGFDVLINEIDNPETYFDQFIEDNGTAKNIDDQIPYWIQIWPSSIALCRYLEEEMKIKSGDKVLELGCGLGIAGIVAGFYTHHVTLSDYMEEAIAMATGNWNLNHTQPPVVLNIDWRNPPKGLKYDTILAADVLYERRHIEDLFRCIDALLQDDGQGRLLLSDPNRAQATFFLALCKEHGYEIASKSYIETRNGDTFKINIFECIKKASHDRD